ncbi:MAG: CvpA family protein [Kiritimatiellae bacterium]|nr:CvpA family protein [Kiritimatiellia bacterium]
MITFIKSISAVDWLTFGIAAFMVFRGFSNGCSGEIGRLIGVLVAAAAGFFGFTPVSRAVFSAGLLGANQQAGRLIVFIIMLVACFSLWLFVSRLLADGIRLVLKQPFDAVVGGVIGGIKAFVLIAVVCMFEIMQPQPAENKDTAEKSYTTRKMSPLIKRINFFQ